MKRWTGSWGGSGLVAMTMGIVAAGSSLALGDTGRADTTDRMTMSRTLQAPAPVGIDAAAVDAVPTSAQALLTPNDNPAVGPAPGAGYRRIAGHRLPSLAKATRLPSFYDFSRPAAAQGGESPMTITLTLKRNDQTGFDRYLEQVYDPHSSQYRHFLTQRQLTQRFGPSQAAYTALQNYLRQHGLQAMAISRNRLTLTVSGTRAAVARAFATPIGDYRLGDFNFYANEDDPALPAALAAHVQTVSGLNSFASPQPARQAIAEAAAIVICTIPFSVGYFVNGTGGFGDEVYPPYLKALGKCIYAVKYALAYGKDPGNVDPPAPTWNDIDGTGQTVGLIEFDSFVSGDLQRRTADGGQMRRIRRHCNGVRRPVEAGAAGIAGRAQHGDAGSRGVLQDGVDTLHVGRSGLVLAIRPAVADDGGAAVDRSIEQRLEAGIGAGKRRVVDHHLGTRSDRHHGVDVEQHFVLA